MSKFVKELLTASEGIDSVNTIRNFKLV